MHSRIFQISEKPIYREDYIDEEKYYENFVGEIADYVDDMTDRESDIDWLKMHLENTGSAKFDGDKFTIVNKAEYFKPKLKEFLSAMKQIVADLNDDQAVFYDGGYKFDLSVYNMQSAYEDKFAFYVDDNGEYAGLETLDSFMRRVNNGDTFYIGATIDYHF